MTTGFEKNVRKSTNQKENRVELTYFAIKPRVKVVVKCYHCKTVVDILMES